ncbi:hypothetical protein [Mycobacteroides abscessus]|uniref:Uncharacterized protein n=1 Tax=Mycobacteroides abscessus subsp. abscessus TaxID=1185650 RepID=A0AB38D7S1_9MYCO|nr:hypothetical protein [Mycobacteroides abscessus]SIC22135.1 Uncharacterised protein [Mycobacteroides abscessus subsp. abscessus]SIC24922.1 Uncharacterised protein [Mycobacteroides abscessus subsp. abscessus]SIC34153.1 Uncharacterised protein [Mycobacteroides abscessus subsp. abscessus]SIC42272.1 Uncharacterised protein [Mycobacteroides abscessus subsp. abscessus]SKR84193.1 Uncharacterised protein [Mycobacteroides abscessus subsp. abscessus]
MSRHVVALDPLTSGCSVVLMAEDTEAPLVKWVPAPASNSNRSIAATVHRTVATAEVVMNSVLRSGKPSLVVMMKPLCDPINKDPSGPRRMMVSGEIMRRLVDSDVKVAEVPPMTLNKWLLGRFVGGTEGQQQVTKTVKSTFPEIDIEDLDSRFRWSTVGLAAAGALTVGIETPIEVTDARLRDLRQMVLPSTWTLPSSAAEWHQKHGTLQKASA